MDFNELKKPDALQFRHNNSDEFVAGYEKEEMDKYLSEVYKLIAELKGDWNDVSNTKIPLNQKVFALLVDRQNPEKLRPAVIIPKMMPAKMLTWTKNKEGDVLCYDVPDGNFHSCNGSNIKYWKYVNATSEQPESSCRREQMRLVFAEMFETIIKSAVNESLAKIKTACVTALDKFCQQMDSSAYNEQ